MNKSFLIGTAAALIAVAGAATAQVAALGSTAPLCGGRVT